MTRRLRAIALMLGCATVSVAAAADPVSASIWTEIPSGTTQNITAVEYQAADRLWFTTAAGAIYTRRPDGSFAQTRAVSGIPLNDIEFQAGGQIGLAVGNGGQVLRSTDAGWTWTDITGIPVSRATGLSLNCQVDEPLRDVNAVRFAGNGRAWIFGTGAQIATSQPATPAQVGAQGTWTDANRAPDGDCLVPSNLAYGYADAFFVPSNPGVGYIFTGSNSTEVFFTSNNLFSPAARKPARPWTSTSLVLAGDPENPNRMWATDSQGSGSFGTALTRDGWQTKDYWTIAKSPGYTFPNRGPEDVDFAGGTVLAAGTAGLILNSVDGDTFHYSSAPGALQTHRWTAVGLASATAGAIAGDGGKLAVTAQANFVPPPSAPAATPTPTPRPVSPVVTPPPAPKAGTSWTSGTVSGSVRVQINGKYVTLVDGQSVPLGHIVDARGGTINLTVAVNATTGVTETATISKGLFRVQQKRTGTKATTTITLDTPPGKERACAVRKGKKQPKGAIRTLSGTVKGSFTIVGEAASAIVRTGSWTVTDTCKGTTVKNVRGKVSVKPKRAKKSKVVRPGSSYLVKAKLFAAKQKKAKR